MKWYDSLNPEGLNTFCTPLFEINLGHTGFREFIRNEFGTHWIQRIGPFHYLYYLEKSKFDFFRGFSVPFFCPIIFYIFSSIWPPPLPRHNQGVLR